MFETTQSLSGLSVGIISLGHIGNKYAQMAKGLGVSKLFYHSRTKKPDIELDTGIIYKEKQAIFEDCDVIFVSVPIGPGKGFIAKEQIYGLKKGSLLISISDPLLFDIDALYERLKSGDIRGAFDENINDERLRKLPLGVWYTPNESSAFNTGKTIEDVSNSSVDTLLNLLTNGKDKYRVN
ncbi:hypothetical protein H0W80_03455 [Candidatus Saccharibacteria bacterium]|nr:hypothetical protein [Candidatus Saccharibacteria bacterium]